MDDMNMPAADKYDTQTAIELVRQAVDYRGWYDTGKIAFKVSYKHLKVCHTSAVRNTCKPRSRVFVCWTHLLP
jgi:hypothetical protein